MSPASASEISENPGDRIGRYKLLEKIGEGEALRRAREAEAILRVGLKTPPTGERAWQLAEMKGRLGRALVVAAMSDVTLEPALRLNSLAEVESLLLESEEQLQREPGAQWRLKLASFDMAQARMKADALQPKPRE